MADIQGTDIIPYIGGVNPGMSEVSSVAPYGSTAGAGFDFTGSTGGFGQQGGIGNFFSQNKDLLGTLGAAGAGVAGLMMNKQGQLPFLPQLQGVANKAAGLGDNAARLFAEQQVLTNPLISGVLPPGAEAKVAQMIQKQKAGTTGTYARLGQTGSTMERSALSDIDRNAEALRFDIAKEMAQVGVQFSSQAISAMSAELQIEGQVYQNLMQAQMKADASHASAVGGFAKAIGSLVGGAGGFMIGGPAGAMAGAGLGGAAGTAVGSAFT